MTVFNTSSTYLLHDLGLSQIALGNISALYFYCAALSLIPYGLWLDYYPTRLPTLLIMSLCVISILLLAFLPSLYTAGLYRAVCGLTNPLIFLVCMRQALTWFPDKTSLAISLIITVGMLGGILQYPFAIAIQQVGWHKALLLDAALGMVLLSFGCGFLSDKVKTYTSQSTTLRHLLTHLKTALSVKENWFCGLFTAFLNLPVMVLAATWGDQYLIMNQGITQSQASLVISMIFFGMIFASPIFGWFADACGSRKKTMFIGGISASAIILVIALIPPVSLLGLIVMFFLLGFACTSQIVSYTVVNEINPLASASTAMSFVSILIYLIGGLGNPIFGGGASFFLNHGYKPVFAAKMAMLFLPMAFVLAIISVFFIRETFKTYEQR